jgi:D-3-phosphoglycerate dehydrogenase / 2-oxoglutarate reductase
MAILLLETLHPDAHELLSSYGPVHLSDPGQEVQGDVPARVEAILTRGRGRITRELMAACPNLRVVARCGVGLDNIDVQAAAQRAVQVIYAPGSTTTAVAEHTLMLMLALARRLSPLAAAVKAGEWGVRDGYSGMELAGKRLGVVGLGAIGQRVAELATALGMQVIYWSRSRRDERFSGAALEELLRQADVISLHTALTAETRHLIGGRELMLMKPSALLINTARGAIVDQQAVCEALSEGRIRGFAADVLAEEPPDPHDPLLQSERALITPHTAALTDATYRAICVRTAENVLAILRGEAADPGAVYRKQ